MCRRAAIVAAIALAVSAFVPTLEAEPYLDLLGEHRPVCDAETDRVGLRAGDVVLGNGCCQVGVTTLQRVGFAPPGRLVFLSPRPAEGEQWLELLPGGLDWGEAAISSEDDLVAVRFHAVPTSDAKWCATRTYTLRGEEPWIEVCTTLNNLEAKRAVRLPVFDTVRGSERLELTQCSDGYLLSAPASLGQTLAVVPVDTTIYWTAAQRGIWHGVFPEHPRKREAASGGKRSWQGLCRTASWLKKASRPAEMTGVGPWPRDLFDEAEVRLAPGATRQFTRRLVIGWNRAQAELRATEAATPRVQRIRFTPLADEPAREPADTWDAPSLEQVPIPRAGEPVDGDGYAGTSALPGPARPSGPAKRLVGRLVPGQEPGPGRPASELDGPEACVPTVEPRPLLRSTVVPSEPRRFDPSQLNERLDEAWQQPITTPAGPGPVMRAPTVRPKLVPPENTTGEDFAPSDMPLPPLPVLPDDEE